MTLLNEEIDMQSDSAGRPALFAWRGHVFRVRRVIGTWLGDQRPEATDAPAGSRPLLVRMATESDQGHASIVEATQDPASDSWTVRRLWE